MPVHADLVLMWAAMSLLMMAPTVLRPARRLARGSSARLAGFLAGYSLIWLAVGVVGVPLIIGLSTNALVLFAGWLAVGLWQLQPRTAALLRRCQGLSPQGSIMRSGMRQGMWCTASCAPLMVVAMATVHALGAPALAMWLSMIALTGFVMWERHPRVPLVAVRYAGVAMILMAAALFVVGGDGHSAHLA